MIPNANRSKQRKPNAVAKCSKLNQSENGKRKKPVRRSIDLKIPTYKSFPLKGLNEKRNKDCGKNKESKRNRQSAECGGNQDVRYQEWTEMTLDYTKIVSMARNK